MGKGQPCTATMALYSARRRSPSCWAHTQASYFSSGVTFSTRLASQSSHPNPSLKNVLNDVGINPNFQMMSRAVRTLWDGLLHTLAWSGRWGIHWNCDRLGEDGMQENNHAAHHGGRVMFWQPKEIGAFSATSPPPVHSAIWPMASLRPPTLLREESIYI